MGTVNLGPEDYTLVGSQGTALTIFKLRKMGIIAEEVSDSGLPFDIIAYPYGRPIRIQVKSTQGSGVKSLLRFRLSRARYNEGSKPYTLDQSDVVALCALNLELVTFRSCINLPEQVSISVNTFENDVVAGDSFLSSCQEVWKHQGLFEKKRKQ